MQTSAINTDQEILKVNVGGTLFCFPAELLEEWPDSCLYMVLIHYPKYLDGVRFLNRNPIFFAHVVEFLREKACPSLSPRKKNWRFQQAVFAEFRFFGIVPTEEHVSDFALMLKYDNCRVEERNLREWPPNMRRIEDTILSSLKQHVSSSLRFIREGEADCLISYDNLRKFFITFISFENDDIRAEEQIDDICCSVDEFNGEDGWKKQDLWKKSLGIETSGGRFKGALVSVPDFQPEFIVSHFRQKHQLSLFYSVRWIIWEPPNHGYHNPLTIPVVLRSFCWMEVSSAERYESRNEVEHSKTSHRPLALPGLYTNHKTRASYQNQVEVLGRVIGGARGHFRLSAPFHSTLLPRFASNKQQYQPSTEVDYPYQCRLVLCLLPMTTQKKLKTSPQTSFELSGSVDCNSSLAQLGCDEANEQSYPYRCLTDASPKKPLPFDESDTTVECQDVFRTCLGCNSALIEREATRYW